MDELLRQNMSELVALLTSMLQNGFDQMPTLFAQILEYGKFYTFWGVTVGCAFIVISLVLFALALWNERISYSDIGNPLCVVFGIALIIIGVIVLSVNAPNMWAIKNTPELFVFHKVMMYL